MALLLAHVGSQSFGTTGDKLLLEDGFFLLLEDGSFLLLE